jgi:hypothetical protein
MTHDDPANKKLEEVFLSFLQNVMRAPSITDINIAAGTAYHEYLGLDPES